MVIKNKKINACMLLKKQCEGNRKALKKIFKQEAHGPHRSREKTVQFNKRHMIIS